jgi:glutaredoxin
MKKYLIIVFLAGVLLMPIAGSNNIVPDIQIDLKYPIENEEVTHTVMVEYATLTTCPPCVTASSQLNSIYNSGDLDFYFVSLVADRANNKIVRRVVDLGVQSVPHVFFDGEYRNILGGQSSETPYRNAITQSGQRNVPDIDIDVSADWLGNGNIKLTVNVQNNEAEDYKGLLRVYIVEEESRWNDNGGTPYHYAAIAMPIDSSLSLLKSNVQPLGDTYTFTKTWKGSQNGFGDITQDNIMVIASVFDVESGDAVEASASEPTATALSRIIDCFSSIPIVKVVQFLISQIIII